MSAIAAVAPKELLPPGDVLLITLDTLRYDVAQAAWRAGETPQLAGLLPADGWERRHAPGSFTYASHHAMFAGFLPTPAGPGAHERLFALRFEGSATTGPNTLVLDAPSVPQGLSALGYRTVCVGGVGFFNLQGPLSLVLPSLFDESHWTPELGVTNRTSTEHQARLACTLIEETPPDQPLFLFLNVSALHQPNWFYDPAQSSGPDTRATHRCALGYADAELAPVLAAMRARAKRRGHPGLGIVCSDHGTTYGEDGYTGHRLAHPHVWDVPYAESLLH